MLLNNYYQFRILRNIFPLIIRSPLIIQGEITLMNKRSRSILYSDFMQI